MTGTLDLFSDQQIAADVTFRAPLASGGNVVYTAPATFFASASAVPPGSRGVFLATTQLDSVTSTIQLTSTSPNPGNVTVNFTGRRTGLAISSTTVTVPPLGRRVPSGLDSRRGNRHRSRRHRARLRHDPVPRGPRRGEIA